MITFGGRRRQICKGASAVLSLGCPGSFWKLMTYHGGFLQTLGSIAPDAVSTLQLHPRGVALLKQTMVLIDLDLWLELVCEEILNFVIFCCFPLLDFSS